MLNSKPLASFAGLGLGMMNAMAAARSKTLRVSMIMRRELSTWGWLILLIAALGLSGNMTGDAVSQESKKNRPTDPALATKQQPTVPEPTEEQLKKARQI